ncbi:MAG: glycosyltransferase family 4 protein [Elusimicrobiaceae bacterium]|jgi:glycosyltransferase involved in cell wall biosynthesis|nr:glycosyltransferase family 4 protein [Elusimicrobiaceae bacterium]MBT3955470.1 glycosyltransferase family 4 protein [Elusimicrobiaceae bacterium]MBT4008222.1 glycosyltransferase family 4 protein [Elusimicrobiaceae bacterium]MBT4403088.1 glycosyltransferase family 4 protein [Elusimicrobiaceae bacterium]MBT4439334.1 glycosyltransferase family 4 protein [Elusimicrobiaceae bacterium]
MKILHINTEPWDSGLTEYSLALAKAQNKKHDVIYASTTGNYCIKKAIELGINTISYNKQIGLIKLLSSARNFKPDVINAHTGSAHSYAVLISLFLPKTKVIRTRADARIMKLKPLAPFLWKHTDGFISANTNISQQFISLPVEKAHIKHTVIMQGIEGIKISGTKTNKSIVIGKIARLDPVKGHSTLISALKKVTDKYPNTILKCAGKEENIKITELKQQANRLGLKKNVKFDGYVEDITKFIKSCDIGVISSIGSEEVSRAALEWLSAKKPLIVTDVGGMQDIVTNNKNAIIAPPKNCDKLAEAIINLIENKDTAQKLANAGYKEYSENFTLEIFAKKTEQFYKLVQKNG